MQPNFRNWKRKQLKEVIKIHNNKAIIYFDSQIKNNLQDLAFASVELGTRCSKNLNSR